PFGTPPVPGGPRSHTHFGAHSCAVARLPASSRPPARRVATGTGSGVALAQVLPARPQCVGGTDVTHPSTSTAADRHGRPSRDAAWVAGRKRMQPQTHTVELTLNGRTLSIETGRVAEQAGGAVLCRYGETVLLATATSSAAPREGIDFLPLTVDV